MTDYRWSAYGTETTVITTITTAAAGESAAGSTYDNSSDKHRFYDVELVIDPNGAPATGGTVTLYELASHDGGTDYNTTLAITAPPVCTVRPTTDAAQTFTRRGFPASPCHYKWMVANNMSVAFSNCVVKVRFYSEAS